MQMLLSSIASRIGGKLTGSDREISGIGSLLEADADQLSFIVSSKYYKLIEKSKAAAFLLEEGLTPLDDRPCIICRNAYLAFIILLKEFYPQEILRAEIHKTAVISPDSLIGQNCSIGPGAVIEKGCTIGSDTEIGAQVYIGSGVKVGKNCLIYPGVKILRNISIGSDVIIHAGTVIGSDGFGYTQHQGKHVKIPHVGGVVIEDEVEIGANCAVDRGTVGNTVIGRGTKIDNLVQIAHNVQIGSNCLIIAQSGMAGSACIGSNVIIAAQSGIVGHLQVGDNCVIAARAVVTHCLPAGSFVSGFPAKPHQEETRIKASMRRLPELLKRVSRLEKNQN